MVRRWTRAALALAAAGSGLVFVGGTPAVAAGTPGSARFVPVAWSHLVDTRSGLGLNGAFRAGQTRVVTVGGHGAVPTAATAVLIDVTTLARSSVTVWPGDVASRPGIATVAGQNRSASAVVKLGTSRLRVWASRATHVVIDVEGYWVPAATSAAGRYRALVPTRLVDTRRGVPQGYQNPPRGGFPRGAVLPYLLPFAASHNKSITPLPQQGVSAVVLSVTVLKARSAGPVKVWAGNANRPPKSAAFSVTSGGSATNLVTVPIYRATDGSWSKYTTFGLGGGGQLVVDLLGYFSNASAPRASDGLFVPRAPRRVFSSALAAGRTAHVQIAGAGGTAATRIRAVAMQIGMARTSAGGSLTAFPSTSPVPNTTTLTYAAHDSRSVGAIAEIGTDGKVAVRTTKAIRLSVYVGGWFLSPPVQTSTTVKRLRLLYAVPRDATTHPGWPEAIRRETETAAEWLLTQTGGRRYRWQTDRLGFVRVDTVHLTQTAAQVSTLQSARSALMARGYNDSKVIYAVYLDATGEACGITTRQGDVPTYSLDPFRACGIYPNTVSQGWPHDTSYVMVHEETHALGAVASCAPHYNAHIPFHTGDNPRDLLWEPRSASDSRVRVFDHLVLDPGHDDYYRNGSRCLNIAGDALWFAPH